MRLRKKRIKNCFEFTTGWCDFSLRRGRITFLYFGEYVAERDEDWTRLEINFSEINWMSIRVVIRGSSYSSRRKVRWSDLLSEFNLIEINGSR